MRIAGVGCAVRGHWRCEPTATRVAPLSAVKSEIAHIAEIPSVGLLFWALQSDVQKRSPFQIMSSRWKTCAGDGASETFKGSTYIAVHAPRRMRLHHGARCVFATSSTSGWTARSLAVADSASGLAELRVMSAPANEPGLPRNIRPRFVSKSASSASICAGDAAFSTTTTPNSVSSARTAAAVVVAASTRGMELPYGPSTVCGVSSESAPQLGASAAADGSSPFAVSAHAATTSVATMRAILVCWARRGSPSWREMSGGCGARSRSSRWSSM
mmetsp:Transcript_26269/g.105126  ORF Transcript_26269/g.105126 Transcript_26269/m.105126 type:complete len:272 (-) Transcript_26269:24-839(-)